MQPDFQRYSCQLALPGFGSTAQVKLQQAKVLVVGIGGLGCPAAHYLAAAGIGTLGLADYDVVSISNLHRQILYTPADAGFKKSHIAYNRLSKQNPAITIISHDVEIDAENVMGIIEGYDIIVDCTDNFDTRYLLNDACVITGKPLVYGAIYQFEGHAAIWNVSIANGAKSPNYRDVFPSVNASQIPGCAEGGVIPTIAGIIGCVQANEVIKYITGIGELLTGKMFILDAQSMQSRTIKTRDATKTNITSLPQTIAAPEISAPELKKNLANNSYLLIDVRSAEERQSFNIGGIHIPLNEIENNAPMFPMDKTLVFYCATGKRSTEAVKKIVGQYPEAKAYSLQGGLKEWV